MLTVILAYADDAGMLTVILAYADGAGMLTVILAYADGAGMLTVILAYADDTEKRNLRRNSRNVKSFLMKNGLRVREPDRTAN